MRCFSVLEGAQIRMIISYRRSLSWSLSYKGLRASTWYELAIAQSIANISVELHLQIRGIREELSGGWTIIESWANPVRLEDCQDLILPRRNVEVRRDMSGLQLW